ncbi:type I restriction-modification system subunit M [Rhodopirellula europaea]|uniref:type I restriction-modification system subunit M n=1 Tax=Rhodopirellula europaea TaxID=1263866 RepID=UPI003D299306
MALKKSEIYSSLWASCDELRGGMDASQYKDYILSLLFIKYISDKYAGMSPRRSPIKIPQGASFADMVALKGTKDIGDKINTKIIEPLAKANQMLSQSDFPDFNDEKLGDGDEKAERLTSLVAIFERKALDFSKNRADGDDILGDAYEYLMRNFATESGKSKGQFYTPAEVSRIMAQIIGIHEAKTTGETTVYDPTCGSGSLLLKVGDQAPTHVTLYGQEKDVATSGLARMNMILHNYPTAEIVQGNTLSDPKFKPKGELATFDYVVANPPFSDKRWSTGLDLEEDEWNRFEPFGTPPSKQGDYAYLLHIVRSLKSTGTGACILPHGVLFRGNAEATIRKKLIRSGYIKGIIGLPANLFYGTGIPACIVVVDKRDAAARKGIFMVDASKGFMKDGPKNRLRSQDIHRIVDTFNAGTEKPGYARHVGFDEIERNEFNLNLPRYIESKKPRTRRTSPVIYSEASRPPTSTRCRNSGTSVQRYANRCSRKTARATAIWRSTWLRSKPRSSSILSSPTTSPA